MGNADVMFRLKEMQAGLRLTQQFYPQGAHPPDTQALRHDARLRPTWLEIMMMGSNPTAHQRGTGQWHSPSRSLCSGCKERAPSIRGERERELWGCPVLSGVPGSAPTGHGTSSELANLSVPPLLALS